MRTNNRWVIAIAGVFFQIALGAVYAWSVFRVPLTKQFGWSISEVTLTFTISIFVLGFAAFFGGLWLNRKGPRIVALTGGAFYGVGVFLASFTHSLAWLLWALWRLLFLNTCAGIAVISQEAPNFQELTKVSAVVAGSMVGIASLGNAVGRVFWAWVSDLITRRFTFLVMFIVQVLLFWFFPTITTASLMTIVTFIVLMCYGGGFGTMPAFTADYFGPKNVGPIYGLMLTAWSFASAVGPLFIAHMRETTGSYAGALHVIAVVMAISILLPVLVRPPRASVVAGGAPEKKFA